MKENITCTPSASVVGRKILDAALLANEAVDDMRKRSKQCLVFKLDFEKTYDNVSWRFFGQVL